MQRSPLPPAMVYRSPTTNSFLLGSNNGQLERLQARAAARAAAIRRKATTFASSPPRSHVPCLSQDQIIELFQNCIKLATENKINLKNTWELKLIDHLSEIIEVETGGGGDTETNFQKASFTLEAGVKIYSVRVDSLHSEAYKLLAEINRAGLEDEQKGENVSRQQDDSHIKKESEKKISSLSTLEFSFEALNVKRFDFAFAVDPVYHQTSAQFDEGRTKGLLLNNLGVYGGCRVLFDSFEVPGKCKLHLHQNDFSDKIDISFAKEIIEQMAMSMLEQNQISPTLSDIICHFDEHNQRSSDTLDVDKNSDATADGFNNSEVEMDKSSFGNFEAWTSNHDDETIDFKERFSCDSTLQRHSVDNHSSISFESDVYQSLENVAMFLIQGLGIPSKKNIWVGPDHWKFRKYNSIEHTLVAEGGSAFTTKRQKNKNQAEMDTDFRISLNTERVDILAPPKSLKSLLLPANRAPFTNTLPEDCHYQPENFVKLFLLPNVMFLEKKRREILDNILWKRRNVFGEALPSWDNESIVSGQHNDEYIQGGVDADELVSKPRQVDKTEVQYDKTSKQVDVQALKEILWDHIQESIEVPETVCKDMVSFKDVLATFSADCKATTAEDVSPHLCFICLLHLANEHGLSIQDYPSLDDLSIHLPPLGQNVDGVEQFSS
ncbi:condensin complex subunit 2 [Ricinus communis]|uniref:condensin complex subunit 2 n=1 Tax=Ricinus communis TaxID=3988 RepID=UPI00077278AD|nr:condensin complex subunit 2 [Ricinus communis]|eukprot:XP_015581036.1 condensin complex subunit 2 [Ricinus communis]